MQVSRKDKSEPRTLTITPSETTHFRVILSKEAMEEEEEEESRQDDGSSGHVCSIIKPEPRAATLDEPPEDSDVLHRQLDLSKSTPPAASDLNRKSLRKTRWTSSPPSRKESVDAGREAAVSPDEGATAKPSTSPFKRTSNTTAFSKTSSTPSAHSSDCVTFYHDNLSSLTPH